MEIVKQLKQIIIILFVFAIVNVCLLCFQSYQMTKDGRIVNFSGIVRGASQKLIKNELLNRPNNENINQIDQIIQGLMKGDKSLDLPVVKSKDFQYKINIVEQEWQTLKTEIQSFRQKQITQERLLEKSENFWNVTNEATFAAENTSINHVQFLRHFYLLLFAINLLILSIIWQYTRKISKNVKDRIRAEISLKSSEEKFQQLAQNINEVFWIADINYQEIIYVSPAYEKVWGKTCDSLYLDINQWKQSIHPHDLVIFNNVLKQFLNNQEETFDLEYRILTSNKKICWIHDRGFIIKNSQNKAYRIAGIAEDITQKKNIEIRLRQELKRTRLLQIITNKIRASLEIKIILNNTANILADKMNIDSCLIYIYDKNEDFKFGLIETNKNNKIKPYEFLNQLDRDNPYLKKIEEKDEAIVVNDIKKENLLLSSRHLLEAKNIKSILTVRISYQKHINGVIELHQYHKIHHWRLEEINLIEAVASQLGIAIAQVDLLAENKQQLEKLNQQNIQLQEKTKQAEIANQAKTNFLSNMSHEIRTPLNAILGFSDLLSQKITEPENLKYLQFIITSSNSLLELINNVFGMVKLESGSVTLQYEAVNLRDIIRQIHQKFSLEASEKNIKFLVNIDDNIPDVLELDKMKLYQIMNNLVDNAIKFTQVGSVTINLRANYFHQSLSTQAEKCSLFISIQDTGIGISEEEKKVIFNRFTQISEKINRNYQGIGLGLTLSQKLIELLGGILELDSQLGKGSTFTLHFPNINVIQSSSQKVIYLKTDKARDYLDTIEVIKPSKINLERLSELLEKLYDYQKKSLPKLKRTLATKEIKKFITLLINWGQEYEVYELLNYAKKINHALDELDIENLSQLIADFPELRNTLLNKLY